MGGELKYFFAILCLITLVACSDQVVLNDRAGWLFYKNDRVPDIEKNDFCKENPDYFSCFNYCIEFPDSIECKSFCIQNPTDLNCQSVIDCKQSPEEPACRIYCEANPQDSQCENVAALGRGYVGDAFHQVEALNKVDMIWIIDNSGSMEDEQNALAVNFEKFINKFIQDGTDFRIGITTTDTSGVYAVNRDDGKFLGQTPVINSHMSNLEVINGFMKNIKVGTDGSPYERGLEATLMALEKDRDPSSNNYNFLREDAFLAIIIVSDENDISPASTQHYIDSIVAFKEDKSKIAIYSIVDTKTSSVFDPFSLPIDLNLFGMNNPGGGRYIAASEITGGFSKDIHDDFSESLLEIGRVIRELIHSYSIDNTPLISTMKLRVNNTFIPYDHDNGWLYDMNTNSIIFRGTFIPPSNAIVEISYEHLLL